MSNITDHIPLIDFGLNQDDANRIMPKGSSDYFLNVLKGEDGSFGELTNLKGNRKITYQLGDAYVYFVAWSCYDPLTRNTYYYIFSLPYDTTGSGDYEYDNRLLRFNEDTEIITTMFYDTKNYFGVDPNIRVKDSFVLGDWLFYNPQTSEPKIIDLTMIYNYTTYAKYDATLTYTYELKVTYYGGLFMANQAVAIGENPVSNTDHWDRIGDSYQDETDIEFDSELRYAFNQIKHIPVYRPVCVYGTDTEKNANNVRGKLFRFSHRYKFFDNSYSRYSAYSDITLPQYDEYYNGEVPGDLDQFNCIDVKIPLHSASLIKEIDIIFQETGGDWKRTKIINRRDITLINQIHYTYRFYNTDAAIGNWHYEGSNIVFEPIDDTIFFEPYDAVPRVANSMEIINKNILTFGGCVEGFDNLDKNDIDVLLTPEIQNISIAESQEISGRRRDNIANNDWVLTPTTSGWQLTLSPNVWFTGGGWAAGDVFILTLNEKTSTYTLAAADVLNLASFCAAIGTVLTTNYPTINSVGGVTAVYIMTTNSDGTQTPINISVSVFYQPSGISEVATTKKRGFKTGAWHPFCIYYYDEAMRRWDAQTSKEHIDGVVTWSSEGTTVYIPMFGEYSPNDGSTAHRWTIDWEVNHLPPAGAKWWRWGYAGNALSSYFVQYIVEIIQDEAPWTKLDITPLQTLKTTTAGTWNQFPQSIIDPYSWQRGDRVRVITEKSSVNNIGSVVDSVYDYEILKYDETTVVGEYWIYVQDFDFAAINAGEDTLVEIYRPIKTDSALRFYEFGELMPIIQDIDGIFVHGCGATGTQDQSSVPDMFWADVPAKGKFEVGDVYHILRTPSKPIDSIEGYFHESQWYSDFYESDDWDKGRPGVETQFGERYLNIVRHSNQYLQNTLINGLSTFYGDRNYKELNDVFGDIMRIIENGDTLKVYQRKKPSSILIGRTEYVDAEGNANIVQTSERILGAIRYSTTNYGTEFSESIIRNNRYVYGFDIYNGVIWRDSANGIFPISGRYESIDGGGDYKMETYFKQKAKALLVSGIDGVDVELTWDERHKNLYVIFKDVVTDSNNEVIMFHEPSNRWICFTEMDQTPEDGWNQMLELQWAIKQGFSGGIGFVFDEDTRFATFNVVTPHDEIAFPTKQDLALSLFAPTVVIDCTVDVDMLGLSMALPPPEILTPYVDTTPNGTSWTALQYGSSVQTTISVLCNPATCTITAIPSWMTLTSSVGDILSVGYSVATGAVLYAYPTSINIGALRTGSITLTNDYGNSDNFTATQLAAVAPTVYVTQSMDTDNVLTVLIGAGTAYVGTIVVDISFTCDHPDWIPGQTFTAYWTASINGVSGKGAGSWSDIEEGAWNNKTINLSEVANSGDIIRIYVKAYAASSPIIDAIASPSLNNLTMTLPAPTVKITVVSPTTLGETWLAADFGVADAKPFQIAVSDAVETRVVSFPSWITIVDSGGNDLKGNNDGTWANGGHDIVNDEICNIYPTYENIGGELSGVPIVMINEYGDTAQIAVTHQAKPAIVPITLSISGSDTTDLAFKTGIYRSGALIDGTIQINLTVTFDSPLYGEGGYYPVYWYATKNGIFAGRSWFANWDELETSTTIFLDAIAEDTDTIIIYFAGNYI